METYMGPGAYPRYGTHSVKVKLQDGAFKGEVYTELGGNVYGASVLQSVASGFEDTDITFPRIPENKKFIEFEDGSSKYGYAKSFVLYDDQGFQLHIDGDDADHVGRMVVGIEIIEFRNEK